MKFCELTQEQDFKEAHSKSTWKSGFFGLQNTIVFPGHKGKNTFSSTFNVMILQMVRNECLRLGVHVDIQVSYKILQLQIPKEILILHQQLGF
jgi:hypothetical protein